MRAIKLYYYDEERNFGDEASIFIAQKLYGPVIKTPVTWCNAMFIGSLMNGFLTKKSRLMLALYLIRPSVAVWGAGFIRRPDLKQWKLLRRFDVRACRGFLTLEILRKVQSAKISDDVVIADPGLLMSRLIDIPEAEKKYALGIVPHYADKDDPILSSIDVRNSVTIDVQQSPEEFMRKLSECENVISSSLHGLVAADSLNIPNIRMVISDRIGGGDFKYDDYYSAFGLDSHEKVDLKQRGFTDADLPGIKSAYRIKPEQVLELQDALFASFPYKRRRV